MLVFVLTLITQILLRRGWVALSLHLMIATVLVALNFSRRKTRLVLGRALKDQNWKLLISSKREKMPAIHDGLLPLMPDEAIVLVAE